MNFGHPDDSAIARLLLAVDGTEGADPATFYCNYRSSRTEAWAERAGDVEDVASPVFKLPKKGKQGLRVPV